MFVERRLGMKEVPQKGLSGSIGASLRAFAG